MKNNVVNDLLNYNNIKIVQNNKMFCFSLDSVLLANFVKINLSTKLILDIGTGNGPIPLILSTKTESKIKAVEIQKEVFDLAVLSVKMNKKEEQIEIINYDINKLYLQIESDTFDIITCNPPFFKVDKNSKLNESSYKTIARHEVKLTLEQLMKISKKLLKNKGSINIVQRPNRLLEIIEEMQNNNIEPKRIQFIYPKVNSDANMVLIEGVKNGLRGLTILPPLYIHNDNGDYTDEVKQFFS